MNKLIKGSGGGGGGGGKGGGGGGGGTARAAVESPNSLRSQAFAQVIDLICEGEIEGLVNGLQSVYLDEVAVQNSDGTNNFNGISFQTRNGTQSQSYIPGFPDVENETAVGLQVKQTTPLVRSISNPNANAVRVTINVPALTTQNTTTGDLTGNTVQFAIDIQTAGGGYVAQYLDKTTTDLGSGTQIGSGNPLYSASINVNWTGDAIASQSATYRIDQSKNGGAWTSIATGTLSGTGEADQWVPVWTDDGWTYIYVPANYATATATIYPALDGSTYQFRVVKTGGSGSFYINGSAQTGITTATISGKTNSKYERSYRIPLTGTGPWDIRVRRITADNTSSNVQNQTWWQSYTEIVDAKLRYPNSAIIGIRVDSSQFTNIPTRAYDVKMLRVQIPSNYNPINRTYSGIWDGTFKIAWTDNPAWCFYDLLTNTRYGLGNYISSSQIDKWALYQISKYCDEFVPNGFGGYEPRFTCNMYLQSKQEAFKVIQDMASVFRGMVYWASGAVTFSQDAPADPTYLYTNSNVIDGAFSYSGSAWKARHTVALVRWNDPKDFYRQKVEYVEDQDGIARYGYVQTDVTALGCTSRSQATRIGRWMLYSERMETEVVSFKTGLEGAVARPGQVVKVADANRAGTRLGGRIVAATSNTITVDSDPTVGSSMTLSVIAADGTVQTQNVTAVTGRVVSVAGFATTPQVGSIWVMANNAVAAQTFRVLSVIETSPGEYEITALAHDNSKFAAVENNLVLSPRAISVLSLSPDAPKNILITESLYQSTSEIKTMVSISWDNVSTATGYVVAYQVNNGNIITLPQTSACSIELRDMPNGSYYVNVYAVNSIGSYSTKASAAKTIIGKSAPPADVQNFSLIPVAGMAMLSWDRAVDLDVLVGGSVRIRHTPMTSGQNWSNAVDVMPSLSGTDQHATAPLLAGTYMAKFVDSSGLQSVNATEIVTTVPQTYALNVVQTLTEDPSYSGTKTNVSYSSTILGGSLVLDSGSTDGSYIFANSADLGAAYPCRITANILAYAFDRADYWDSRTSNINDWTDIDGLLVDDANAKLYMRTTSDNPGGTSPTWSEWKPFFVGDYTARGFQFKVLFHSDTTTHTTAISTLNVTIDMPDRVESLHALTSGTGTYHVTYANAFWQTPSVGVTADAMASGDYFTITNKTASGFDIIFKNASGTTISRTFDVMAKGFGRLI